MSNENGYQVTRMAIAELQRFAEREVRVGYEESAEDREVVRKLINELLGG